MSKNTCTRGRHFVLRQEVITTTGIPYAKGRREASANLTSRLSLTDSESAHEVAEADGEAAAEDHVSGGEVRGDGSPRFLVGDVEVLALEGLVLADEDERHDDAENG